MIMNAYNERSEISIEVECTKYSSSLNMWPFRDRQAAVALVHQILGDALAEREGQGGPFPLSHLLDVAEAVDTPLHDESTLLHIEALEFSDEVLER